MNVFIVGVCGTLNSALAVLALEKGYKVCGYDKHQYPPTSTLLQSYGVKIHGSLPNDMGQYDCVVIGNAFSRGTTLVESILNRNLPVYSVGEFLKFHILPGFHVMAVSGTHGKSTTSSMLTWILSYCDYNPSYLIGAVAKNFNKNAAYTDGDYFVIEADEYDTIFYDKRAKFMHYHPQTLIINNIEFDHADIYSDIESIYYQFKQLIKTVPNNGLIVYGKNKSIQDFVFDSGCWSPTETVSHTGPGADWTYAHNNQLSNSLPAISYKGEKLGDLSLKMKGVHNIQNALAAIAAANHIGISPQQSLEALTHFKGLSRRMEYLGKYQDACCYDDFGHHPTAIKYSLDAVQKTNRLYVMLECGSYTMRSGKHLLELADALKKADFIYLKNPDHPNFDAELFAAKLKQKVFISLDVTLLLDHLEQRLSTGDTVIVFSSRNFDGMIQTLKQRIQDQPITLDLE
jgi:UDP-N-acetylmuramate: L-alanyl-gamma-D-glutamyl-meso-diaminopimelate ligase